MQGSGKTLDGALTHLSGPRWLTALSTMVSAPVAHSGPEQRSSRRKALTAGCGSAGASSTIRASRLSPGDSCCLHQH